MCMCVSIYNLTFVFHSLCELVKCSVFRANSCGLINPVADTSLTIIHSFEGKHTYCVPLCLFLFSFCCPILVLTSGFIHVISFFFLFIVLINFFSILTSNCLIDSMQHFFCHSIIYFSLMIHLVCPMSIIQCLPFCFQIGARTSVIEFDMNNTKMNHCNSFDE